MTTSTDITPVIQEILDKLVAEYAPEKVVLLGSYAYGQPRPYSDIDLLIIKDTSERKFERLATVSRILTGTHGWIPLDTLVLTPQELQERLKMGDHFIEEILEKGNVLLGGAYQPLMEREESLYVAEWLRFAERDFARAEWLLDEGDPELAGFCLQQAVEKFLKAFLPSRGWRLQRTHNFEVLLQEALAYDASLEQFRGVCEEITKFYNARPLYPDDLTSSAAP